jgi:hypothetical protein
VCGRVGVLLLQGAKPGEGGQLPGKKVSPYIANLRRSKPGEPTELLSSAKDRFRICSALCSVLQVGRVVCGAKHASHGCLPQTKQAVV